MAMQGIGAVIPIYALFDKVEIGGKIFFYDLMGATFESVDFCTTGSGSHIIRGLFTTSTVGETPLAQMDDRMAPETVFKMLETAAEYDTATGGCNSDSLIYPTVMRVRSDGIRLKVKTNLNQLFVEWIKKMLEDPYQGRGRAQSSRLRTNFKMLSGSGSLRGWNFTNDYAWSKKIFEIYNEISLRDRSCGYGKTTKGFNRIAHRRL